MSGDIGVGATRAAIMLAQKVVSSSERPPGMLQRINSTPGCTTFDDLNDHDAVVPALQWCHY